MKSLLLIVLASISDGGGAPPPLDSSAGGVCQRLLGETWAQLDAPPDNARQLLQLVPVSAEAEATTLWFAGSDRALAMCRYSPPEGCGSTAHVFLQHGDTWATDDSATMDMVCTG